MKPASFDYIRPASVSEALAALEEDPGARVLAGGQSLVLEMNYRRVRPTRLVDINGIAGLDALELDGSGLRVGALVRHARFEQEPAGGAPLGRLLARVSRHVAHPPIRNRGTMVGSLAYAHPAAEWPAVALALDAELTLVTTAGVRTLPAASFFLGPFATACAAGELVTEARLPALGNAGVGFVEHRRTQASFAVVAAIAVLELENGTVTTARIGLAGAADRPLRAHSAERELVGAPAGDDSFRAAAAAAALESSPVAEPHYTVEFRRHVVLVLVRRALESAAADARQART